MRDESGHENSEHALRFIELAAVLVFLMLVVGAYAAMIIDLDKATLRLSSAIVASQTAR
jgi:uncharacterized iron-regulated membrane protein